MICMLVLAAQLALKVPCARGFWDVGTTTEEPIGDTDKNPRQSFFRWQRVEFHYLEFWMPWLDWKDVHRRRRLNCVAGISIDFLPLGTAIILNRRTLITSANFLEPYVNRQKDVRIWALGRAGYHYTPYRYRCWRWRRVLPRSNNPEHWHGPRGVHVPRHDVAVMHSLDQIYLYFIYPDRYHYAYRAYLGTAEQTLLNSWDKFEFVGSGYEYMVHIRENYKIFYGLLAKSDIVNCERYLPKWWGKFICLTNVYHYAGVPNGGGFFSDGYLIAIGAFEIRYNDDRIMVFTDLRYYMNHIYMLANVTGGAYYEYAYPQWGVALGWVYDGHVARPYIPQWQVQYDLWPLGK